jgi:hypothetical protein
VAVLKTISEAVEEQNITTLPAKQLLAMTFCLVQTKTSAELQLMQTGDEVQNHLT